MRANGVDGALKELPEVLVAFKGASAAGAEGLDSKCCGSLGGVERSMSL